MPRQPDPLGRSDSHTGVRHMGVEPEGGGGALPSAMRRTHRSPKPRRAQYVRSRYAAPSNMLVTEPSSKTSWMALASSGAIGSTVSLSKRFSGPTGRVSVTTT